MKRVLFLAFIFVLLLVPVAAQKNTVLDQKQAVALAERFVAENGYTDKRAVKKNLFLEAGENRSDIKNILAARFDSIERWAVYAVIKESKGQPVWAISFRLVDQDYDYNYAREVQMSLDGRKIWMEKNPTMLPATGYGDCTGGN